MKLASFPLVLFLLISHIVSAQDSISIEDYNRAIGFLGENINNKRAFNLHIQANWFPDSTGVWYVHQSPDSKKYLQITLPGKLKSDLFDHVKLAALLSDSMDIEIEANDLPLTKVEYKSAKELLLSVKKLTYILNTEHYTLSIPEEKKEENSNEEPSPDNKWIAYEKDYNLYIKSTTDSTVKQLSTSGKKGYEYASWYGWYDIMEGENGERPGHFGVEWSDDGEWIHTNICDLRRAQKMYLLDWSVDTLYRPRLLSYYRGSPGDTTMIYMEPVFFHVHTGKEIKADLPASTHINSVDVEWSHTPGKVYIRRSSRGFQNLNIYTFDIQTLELESIYAESSTTNIDNFTHEFAKESGLMFFLSEKNGWRQLYSLDLKTNSELGITKGDFYVNSIERIDEERQIIYFLASGIEKDRNPYYQHLYSISFKGEDLKLLTKENCNHRINISPDGNYFIDNYSTVNVETITALRNLETGEIIMELGHADVTMLDGWTPPEIFTVLARDGETSIYGALWKPVNFDPEKKYPIIELSYTGPHTQLFPKDFSRAFLLQSYAELGFVALVVDGLGSSGRSKQFHNYSYKNLGGSLEDHVGAIRQLGEQYSWIDTTRVGIFGHSAGGYDAAHALLAYPNFYKVAVASSADHDHRMEKAWWPEMYMGWPVDSAYHLQSNITMAGNLKGKLLITHGGIDENVNPSATFKLAEALIKADKQFDMLILPSQRHGYRGAHQKYFTKTRWNYFVKHLRGVEPIWDFKWE
jgi:dipeptidyl-peptidase-4